MQHGLVACARQGQAMCLHSRDGYCLAESAVAAASEQATGSPVHKESLLGANSIAGFALDWVRWETDYHAQEYGS